MINNPWNFGNASIFFGKMVGQRETEHNLVY
jgi:hypothetical protein